MKTVRITDVARGAEVHALNAPDVVLVDFSPDGRRLATFSVTSGVVKVWDTATGQELLTIREGPAPPLPLLLLVPCSAWGHDAALLPEALHHGRQGRDPPDGDSLSES